MTKSKGAAVLATFAAVAPILLAAVRGAADGWTPTGDNAFSGVRAWDVFTGHTPLLGTWSSASTYTELDINHPGPLHFDLLALPVRLLGHGAGTAIGMGLINALSVAGIAWLLHRLLGPAATAAGMGLCACLAWAMGSEMLYDPWNPYATLFPFALFLVAVWGVAAFDRAALLIMVVAGSYVLETHLSYSILVPGTAAIGLVVAAVRLRGRRRADREAWPALRKRSLRWLGGAAGLGLVLWLQPVIQQFTTDEQGNLTGLLRSLNESTRTPGLGRTLRALGGTLAVPPAWLPPSYADPSFELDGSGRPTWLAALGLVALAMLLAGLGWRARRRGSTTVALAALIGLAALATGLLTALRAPIVFEMVPTYFRWMWPMGMFLWMVVAVAVVDEVASAAAFRRWRDAPAAPGSRDRAVALVVPGLVLALVAGIATVPRVDHGTASPPWTVDVVDSIDGRLLDALEDEEGPLLVELSVHLSSLAAGPALFAVLQDAGLEFYVSDWPLIRQLGEDRRYEEGDADRLLRVTGDPSRGSAREGERLLVAYSPLSRTEVRELERLNEGLTELVEEQGLVWSGDAEAVYEALEKPDRMAEMEDWAERSPQYLVEAGLLRTLWTGGDVGFAGHPLLDTAVYRPEVLDRWAQLQELRDRTLRVYISDVPPPEAEDDEGDDAPEGDTADADADPATDPAAPGSGG
jgi:hypothetical protein